MSAAVTIRTAWGKSDDHHRHSLSHHCMDVAAVFMRMLELPVIRNRLETAAQGPLRPGSCWRLGALVFLHDVGKLHPGFQAKGWPSGLWHGPTRNHLDTGCEFLVLAWRRSDHPFHNTMKELSSWGAALDPLLEAVIAHHGRPFKASADPTQRGWKRLAHYDWAAETCILATALRSWFGVAFEPCTEQLPNEPRFHHLVAGLVALADWIGSDRRFFCFVHPFDPGYYRVAHRAAEKALASIGFDPGTLIGRPAPTFSKLAGFAMPRPAQAAVGTVGTDARLLILEAETGSGKTEAALWRFTQLLAEGVVSGLYFAVPTRAAARQLHHRINGAMHRVFGSDTPEVVLAIPGMVRAGEAVGRRLPDWNVLWDDGKEGPNRWAAEHATRFLAAPIAVGTVDQVTLAGLQVKHAHLRGSALNRSLLVIDEVHASDAYMTEVLARLLEGHLATGGYALLMSATLGARARVRWIGESEGGLPDFATTSAAPYPAVWVKGERRARPVIGEQRGKTVHLEVAFTMDPATTAKRAIAAARRGARVLVIRNTVDMAIATWTAVREAGGGALLLQAAGSPALHHGRFAVEDRELLDRIVEDALRPDPDRALRGRIVIGTQTLEQSLDIDADYLITDLCPMDVLLQRIGRVHRHDLPRTEGFERACVAVLLPAEGLDRLAAPAFDNGLGSWTADGEFGGIYQDLVGLELTRRLIQGYKEWKIPDMNRMLVEATTHPDRVRAVIAEKGEDWARYERDVGGAEAAARMIARQCELDRSRRFESMRFPGSDERIMTRLGEEGVVIPLESSPQGPFGQPVTRITLPAHWSKGIGVDDTASVEIDEPGVLILTVGVKGKFLYSRSGLSRS